MKIRRVGESAGLCILLFLIAHADTESGVVSYSVAAKGDQFTFVMLGEDSQSSQSVRDTYPSSGMYKNDGSRSPIWKVNWVAYAVPIDETYVVRLGRWQAKGNYDEEALSFFKNGALLKTYAVKDFVYFPSLLPHTVSHYEWIKPARSVNLKLLSGGSSPFEAGFFVDETKQIAKFETYEGATYEIDYRSGEIVASTLPFKNLLYVFATVVFLFVVGLLVYGVAAKRRRVV